MYFDSEVRPQIDNFLKSVELSHLQPVIRRRSFREPLARSPIYYRRKNKEIIYCLEKIKSSHRNYTYLSRQEFVILLLLQEIGFHLYWEDQEEYLHVCAEKIKENPENANPIKYELAKKALSCALPYVPEKLLVFYGMLNSIYLANFDDTLDAQRLKYEYLSAHYRKITPEATILPTKTSLNKHLRWPKAAWVKTKAEILPKVLDCIFDEKEFAVEYFENDTMIIVLKDKKDIRIIQHSYYDVEEEPISYIVDTANFESRKIRHIKNLQEA